MSSGLLYHPLPCFLGIRFLIEPGARLTASPSNPPDSTLFSAKVTGAFVAIASFVCGCEELSKHSYLLNYLSDFLEYCFVLKIFEFVST